jgi:hypothetical protein
MAAKLGDFLVGITTKVNDKDIKKLQTELGGLAKTAAKVGASLAAGLGAAAYGYKKFIHGTAMETAELSRLSKDLSISSEDLQTLGRSFEIVGASGDDLIGILNSLSVSIGGMKFGDSPFADFAKVLQLKMGDLSKTDNAKNFEIIRKRFKDLSAMDQLYAANKIGLGAKTVRILRLGEEEYQKLRAKSLKAPLASKEDKDNAEKYAESIVQLTEAFKGLQRTTLNKTLPSLEGFIGNLTKLFENKDFQKNIGEFFDVLLKQFEKLANDPKGIIDKVSAFANALGTIAKSIEVVGSILSVPYKIGEFIGKTGAEFSEFFKDDSEVIKSKRFFETQDKQKQQRKEIISNNISSSRAGDKTVIINNKAEIKIDAARKDTNELIKSIPSALDQAFGITGNKQAAQSFKSGSIR